MYQLFAITISIGVGGILFTYALLRMLAPKPRQPTPEELEYKVYDQAHRFSNIMDKPTVSLSVIIPAYNEFKRLTPMIEEALQYLLKRVKIDSKFSFEIIVVDDGSTDDTFGLASTISDQYSGDRKSIKVMKLAKNRGKGGAVAQVVFDNKGILASSGRMILFADADGATRFSDLDLLLSKSKEIAHNDLAVVVGSRAHMVSSDAVVKVILFNLALFYS